MTASVCCEPHCPIEGRPAHIRRMRTDELDRLAPLLTRQHGAIRSDQLEKLGVSKRRLDYLVAKRVLVRMAPRTFRPAAIPITWHHRVWVAHLSAGPDSALSHRTAAVLLGLLDTSGRNVGRIELIVPRHRRSIVPGVRVHTSLRLERADFATRDGLRVTSAARTLIDLAADGFPAAGLTEAFDDAVRLGLVTPDYLRRRLDTLGRVGRAGVALLDEILVDGGGHSFLERRFLQLVRHAKIPRPSTQVVHRRSDATIARVDFEWSDARLIVEVNGRRGHASDAERSRDAHRRNELQALGFRVLEFTTRMVLDRPEQTANAVRGALASPWLSPPQQHPIDAHGDDRLPDPCAGLTGASRGPWCELPRLPRRGAR